MMIDLSATLNNWLVQLESVNIDDVLFALSMIDTVIPLVKEDKKGVIVTSIILTKVHKRLSVLTYWKERKKNIDPDLRKLYEIRKKQISVIINSIGLTDMSPMDMMLRMIDILRYNPELLK